MFPIVFLILCQVEALFSWKYCSGSKNILDVLSLDITNCGERSCEFVEDTAVSLRLIFTSPQHFDKLSIEIEADASYFKQKIPGIDKNMCNHLSPKCPLEKDQTYTYAIKMKVPAGIPFSIDVTAKVKVLDDNNQDVMCLELKGKLVKSKAEPKETGKGDKKKSLHHAEDL
ncbi:Mite group 2 allergen Eur m 2 [Thelohanellus kitauei]|uniref:Mite group 2 allergen Eur m 2 n=1 Tax=Thelohanellus kitauei TaxID=669202 RepID=A0A0C2N824_THEKT|nr:Mite group 2 allergen Eur m 2 [Thelohanellus kitauei]